MTHVNSANWTPLPQGFGQYTPWFQQGLGRSGGFGREADAYVPEWIVQYQQPTALPPATPPEQSEFQRQIEKHLDMLRQLPHDPPNPFEEQRRRASDFLKRYRDAKPGEAVLVPAPLSAAPPARRWFLRLCRRFARWIERLDL